MDDEQRRANPVPQPAESSVDPAETHPAAADPASSRPAAREALDREMRAIKDDVLRMGSLVEEAIRGAVDALVRHDAEAALAVIVGDARINEMQRRIAVQMIATIATQSPVARDLRFLMALDRVSIELERMGDHASSVAKQARKLAPLPPLKRYVDLPEMGERVAQQIHGILLALVDLDEDAARMVAASDDEIDHTYRRTFDELIDLMRADPGNVDRGTRLLFAAYYTERIGDRVTNIAEDVVYLATGRVEDLNP